jgi:hypothetical protein
MIIYKRNNASNSDEFNYWGLGHIEFDKKQKKLANKLFRRPL